MKTKLNKSSRVYLTSKETDVTQEIFYNSIKKLENIIKWNKLQEDRLNSRISKKNIVTRLSELFRDL